MGATIPWGVCDSQSVVNGSADAPLLVHARATVGLSLAYTASVVSCVCPGQRPCFVSPDLVPLQGCVTCLGRLSQTSPLAKVGSACSALRTARTPDGLLTQERQSGTLRKHVPVP